MKERNLFYPFFYSCSSPSPCSHYTANNLLKPLKLWTFYEKRISYQVRAVACYLWCQNQAILEIFIKVYYPSCRRYIPCFKWGDCKSLWSVLIKCLNFYLYKWLRAWWIQLCLFHHASFRVPGWLVVPFSLSNIPSPRNFLSLHCPMGWRSQDFQPQQILLMHL